MRRVLKGLFFALLSLASVALAPPAAQARDPYSIMTDEGQSVPTPRPVRRARGSSSPSPVPPYRSTVTRPGVAPKAIEPYPIDRPGSSGGIVPGVTTATGAPALAPSRPAGQSFQDRAVACQHSGASQGVGAGQIGAFTGGCVNQ
jgi:hypothetical protein